MEVRVLPTTDSLTLADCVTAWGADPPDTKYGFEDDVRVVFNSLSVRVFIF